VKRLLAILAISSVSFVCGIAYDAHAQNAARTYLCAPKAAPAVRQSSQPLPARTFRT